MGARSLRPDDVCIGIYGLIQAITFLHEQGIVHNQIVGTSIYVTVGPTDSNWLLGGMEYASKSDKEMSPDLLSLISDRDMLNEADDTEQVFLHFNHRNMALLQYCVIHIPLAFSFLEFSNR
jgi:hypothetical protein